MENHQRQANAKNPFNYLRIAFKGPSLNKEGFGAKVYLKNKGSLQYQYFTPVHGYLSAVEPFLHFGLGGLSETDSVEVFWPDGKYQLIRHVKANQVLHVDHADAVGAPVIDHT